MIIIPIICLKKHFQKYKYILTDELTQIQDQDDMVLFCVTSESKKSSCNDILVQQITEWSY